MVMDRRAIAARVAEMPRSGIRRVLDRVASPGVVNLASGDPDFATPAHVLEAAASAAAQGRTHYTNGRGLLELRDVFGMKLATENGFEGVRPDDQVIVVAGALNGLAATFLAVLDPGDRVLVPDPGFANYGAQVLLAGGVPVPVTYPEASGFAPDLDAIEDAAPGARAIIVNSPSNPTGAVLSRSDLEGIASLACRHDLLVVSDEAYEHLVYDGKTHISIATLDGMRERTVSIFSMSKSWAMTGWRIGFVVGPEDVLDAISKVEEHLIGCAAEVSQHAAISALTGPTGARDEMIACYAARRRVCIGALGSMEHVSFVEPGGAFYCFPHIDLGQRGLALAEVILDGCGVATVPGDAFGTSALCHVRLSYSCPDAQLEDGLGRLKTWLGSLPPSGPE